MPRDPPAQPGMSQRTPPPTWTACAIPCCGMVHGGHVGRAGAAFDLNPYDGAPPRRCAARAPDSVRWCRRSLRGPWGLSDFRKQLDDLLRGVRAEVEYNGYPIWHPLPFQFPDDPECARHADEFMLGDEMLVAPIYDGAGKRSLYLPQGIWTNLETNEAIPGRRTITVETPALPVFARNGTIVPLDSPGGMALHYFPKLGAEFFLLETGSRRIHAGARRAGRRHHAAGDRVEEGARLSVGGAPCRAAVGGGLRRAEVSRGGVRRRDGRRHLVLRCRQKNLQVRVRVAAGEDCIVNLSF